MGVDYNHAGSTSYPRFDEELCAIAKVFGGVKVNDTEFVFPEWTNEILVRWFNDIYGEFTIEETRIIWEHISEHIEIQEISYQIWYELEVSNAYDEEWDIG